MSFRLCLKEWREGGREGHLAENDRSPGRESTQRLCTCFSSVVFIKGNQYTILLLFLKGENLQNKIIMNFGQQ